MATPTPKPSPFFTGNKGATTGKLTGATGTPTPSSSMFFTNKGTVAPKPKTGAPKADNSPAGQLMSFGQSVIDVISTPLYFVEGAVNEVGRQAAKGKPDIFQIFSAAGRNATAWTRGEKTVTGSTLLKNVGASDDFVSSLATDILLDPLTYTPGVVISAPLKAILAGTKAGIKASNVAAKTGKISAELAVRTGAKIAEEAKGTTGTGLSFVKAEKVTPVPLLKSQRAASEISPIAAKQTAKKAMMEKFTYQVAPVEGQATYAQIIASGLEGAYKGARMSTAKSFLENDLRKFAAKEAKFARKQGRAAKAAAAEGIDFTPKTLVETLGGKLAPVKPRIVTDPNTGAPKVPLEDGSNIEFPINQPYVTPKGTYVFDGTNMHQFADEDAATAWLTKSDQPINVQPVRGVAPVLDTPPVMPITQTVLKGVKVPEDAKAAQARLTNVDKLISKTKGVTAGSDDIVKTIASIASPATDDVARVLSKMDASTKNILKVGLQRVDGSNILSSLRQLYNSADNNRKSVAIILANLKVVDSAGRTVSVGEVIKGFDPKTMAYAQLDTTLRSNVEAAINNLLSGTGTAAKTEASRFAEVAKLVGEDLAKEIKATGALNPDKATNTKVLQAILAKLPTGAIERGYTSMEDLAAGIRAGDNIPQAALLKLVKAIDPDSKAIKDIEAGTSKNPVAQLKAVLATEGVYTVSEMRHRISLMDTEALMSATGLSFKDVATAYIDGRLAGQLDVSPLAIANSREAAADMAAKWASEPDAAQLYNDAVDSLGRGLKGQVAAISEAMAKADAERGVNIIGNAFLKEGEKESIKAFRLDDMTQFIQTKVLASIAAKNTWRRGEKIKEAARKGKVAEFQRSPIAEFAVRMNMAATASLALTGKRFVNVTTIKQLGGDIANNYTSYVHAGDVAHTLNFVLGEPGNNAFGRAFFPMTYADNVTNQSDSFSPASLGAALNKILKSAEDATPISADEISAILIDRPSTQAKWSPSFAKQSKRIADDLAKAITDKTVVEDLVKTHQDRLLAETEDMLKPSRVIAEQMFDTMLGAWRATHADGTISLAKQHEAAKDYLMKFAVASDLMRLSYGKTGEAVFRSTARMFLQITGLDSGEVITEAGKYLRDAAQRNPKNLNAYSDFVEAVNTIRLWNDAEAALTPPVPSHILEKAQLKLAGAEEGYKAVREDLARVVDAATEKAWRTSLKRAQTTLNKARAAAGELGIRTRHWFLDADGTERWVDSSAYNHADAVANAKNLPQARMVTPEGIVNRSAELVDSPEIPKPKKLTAKQQAAVVERYKKEMVKLRLEKAKTAKAQSSEDVVNSVEEVEQLLPGDNLAQAERLIQEGVYRTVSNSEMLIITPTGEGAFTYSPTYRGPKEGNLPGMETRGRGQRVNEALSATGGMRYLTRGTYNKAESTLFNAVSSVHSVMTDLIRKYSNKLTPEQFKTAFSAAMVGRSLEGIEDAAVVELSARLNQMVGIAKKAISKHNVSKEALSKAFRSKGLTVEGGIFDPINMPDDKLDQIFTLMPWAEPPTGMTDEAVSAFKDRQELFAKRAADKKSPGADEFTTLARTIDAIQYVITEQSLADDMLVRHNYLADGFKTVDEALATGDYVVVKALPSQSYSMTQHFPETAAEGNLFHKDIAKSIAAHDREFNKTFNENMKPWLANMNRVLSFFKATQTILRPGHLVANMIGDMSVAFMAGMSPSDLRAGASIALEYAGGKVRADYTRNGLKTKYDQMLNSLEGVGGREYVETAEGWSFVIGGKQVKMSRQELTNRLIDANILTGDIHVNDSAGMYEELIAMTAKSQAENAERGVLIKKLAAGLNSEALHRAWSKAIKPAGDTVAYMGNIPRAGTAMRVAKSKSWNSVEEMFAAMNEAVNMYHPTIQSLSATERRGPRLLFTYYTWLRGAHNAFIDLAVNHTAAMTIPSKILYNQSIAAGFEPSSIGNLWGDKQDTPSYLNYSTYGPTMTGPRGAMMYKPSVLPLDVLDNWNLQFDPTKSVDQQTFQNLMQTGRMFGKNVNLLAQPGIEFLTGTDMATGKPTQARDLQSAVDRGLSNIGTIQLLKSLGLYTPASKAEGTANPQTARDEQIAGLNFWLGLRQSDIYTPSNIKNAQSEQGARTTAILKEYYKNQGK